jgi:hypothetical protein
MKHNALIIVAALVLTCAVDSCPAYAGGINYGLPMFIARGLGNGEGNTQAAACNNAEANAEEVAAQILEDDCSAPNVICGPEYCDVNCYAVTSGNPPYYANAYANCYANYLTMRTSASL